MATVHGEPAQARVRWDRSTRRPREVAWGGHVMRIVGLASVRDERAAYPAGTGPRVTYVVQTEAGSSAVLVFDGRRRRWYIEAGASGAA